MTWKLSVGAVVIGVALAKPWIAVADESGEASPLWKRYCAAAAGKYELSLPDQSAVDWRLLSRPVFSHQNPIDREEHGLVYLWTQADGRPVAAVTVIVVKRNGRDDWYDVHELHSLHDEALVATYDGETVWSPESGGLTWHVVPGAPPPAANSRQMQLQAKAISRKFTSTAKMKKTWKLRRIETPIYKYEFRLSESDDEEKLVCGALFAYCRATDPESLLALEVRKASDGAWRWHYAAAAFNFSPTTFSIDGQEVWREALGRDVYRSDLHHHGAYRHRNFQLEAMLKGWEQK